MRKMTVCFTRKTPSLTKSFLSAWLVMLVSFCSSVVIAEEDLGELQVIAVAEVPVASPLVLDVDSKEEDTNNSATDLASTKALEQSLDLPLISVSDKPNHLTHRVVVGDTLWNVAKRLRSENMSMAEAMDILYDKNPEAFLNGNSTQLIEGSVVSFESPFAPEDITKLDRPKESLEQLIPQASLETKKIESTPELTAGLVEPPGIALELTPDLIEQDLSRIERLNQEANQDSLESEITDQAAAQITSAPLLIEIEPQAEVNQKVFVVKQPQLDPIETSEEAKTQVELSIEPTKENTDQVKSLERLKVVAGKFRQWFSKVDVSLLRELSVRLKQLPVDLWFFVGALLLAFVVTRLRAKASPTNEESNSQAVKKPIDSVIHKPADSNKAEVFAKGSDKGSVKHKKQDVIAPSSEPFVETELPGIQELEAQFREDADEKKPLASNFKVVDFEEDIIEIDPLQIKLDMASLCIEMGDIESAQAILEEVIGEADKQGKAKAREILDSIET